MKNVLLCLIQILVAVGTVLGQATPDSCRVNPYEYGFSASWNPLFGDMKYGPVLSSHSGDFGFGGFISRQLTSRLSIRATLAAGHFAGKDANPTPEKTYFRGMEFSSLFSELTGQVVFYPVGRKIGADKRGLLFSIEPYLFAGLGINYSKAKLDKQPNVGYLNPSYPYPDKILADQEQAKLFKNQLASVVPIGLGASAAISEKVRIHAEVGYRYVNSDYLDGFKESSYLGREQALASRKDDRYYLVNIGITVRLAQKDRDHDGVSDKCDECPAIAGERVYNGCPDTDGDGVPDPEDSCPDEFGDPATCGCPDDDKDGVPNACDCCPYEKGDRENHGCPAAHKLEYEHKRIPNPLRYCPLCPVDLPSASRSKKESRSSALSLKTR